MDYCLTPKYQVLENIQNEAIPNEALVRRCCWTTVCRVRARQMWAVDKEIWSNICAKRGYLRAQQNSRGF